MANTSTFYVSSKDNKIRETTEPSREYFVPGGKKEGQAKYIIEVFGNNNKNFAKQVRDMLDDYCMSDDIFEIKIETR